MSEFYQEADVEESHAGLKEASFGVKFWTPAGVNGKWTPSRVRICPPRKDHKDKKYYHWVAVHGNLPGVGRPVLCPARMYEEPCMACDMGRKAWQVGDKEAAAELGAGFKALVNVIPLNDDGSLPEDASIKVWSMPKQVLELIEDEVAELDRGERNITSPLSGRDVIVGRKGTQAKGANKTEYKVKLAPPSEMAPEMLARLNEMVLLTDVYKRRSSEEIRGIMTGEVESFPQLTARVENDPWGDDAPVKTSKPDVLEGIFEEVKVKAPKEDTTPWDEDEEEDDIVTTPNDVEKVNEERAKLMEKLRALG